MRAIILVGGFGTRLRPLTTRTPKQMLPIVDRPMIERVVAKLALNGVTEAILSLGYRPDAFTRSYPDGRCAGVDLHYAVEPEPLDTAGAVRFAALDAEVTDRFIVVNGDVLTDLDLADLLSIHEQSGAEGTIALTPVEDPSRYGVVPIDSEGRVEAFVEKPSPDEAPSKWINAGAYVFEPSVIARIPDGRKVSVERETFPAMVADRSLYAVQSNAYWVDAGTAETYLQVQLDLIDGVRGTERPISESASVDSEATVDHSVVMSDAVVGAGATVRDSLIMPGAVVQRGATVSGSIVGPGANIGERAIVSELTVIGEAVSVGPVEHLKGVRVPAD